MGIERPELRRVVDRIFGTDVEHGNAARAPQPASPSHSPMSVTQETATCSECAACRRAPASCSSGIAAERDDRVVDDRSARRRTVGPAQARARPRPPSPPRASRRRSAPVDHHHRDERGRDDASGHVEDDLPTHAVADEHRPFDPRCSQSHGDVVGERRHGVALVGCVARAVAAQVDGDDPMVDREVLDLEREVRVVAASSRGRTRTAGRRRPCRGRRASCRHAWRYAWSWARERRRDLAESLVDRRGRRCPRRRRRSSSTSWSR